MNTRTKRILCGAGAIAVALALILGGTFAYTLFEHKSNPMRNKPGYQGRLVEDFDPDPDWNPDCKIKKEVSVKNMGGTEQFPGNNWGDIFVRVKLKEHMDVTPINYVYYPENDTEFNTRFMVDKNGNFVRFAATGAVPTAAELATIKSDSIWNSVISDSVRRNAFLSKLQANDFIKLRGYYDDQDYWYLVTKEGDPNGQYGAYVVMDRVPDDSKRYSITNSTRAAGVDYSKGIVTYDPSEHDNEECLYPTHMWDQVDPALCDLESHKYASWDLGDSIIMAADWDGLSVDKWILDPATGWATWGNALKPGQSTDLLLKAIQPLLFPDGDMLYVIHVDMQATDRTEMLTGDWDGDDWIIKETFGGDDDVAVSGVRISPSAKSMTAGETFQLSAVISPGSATNKKVTWASDNTAVADVDQNGLVTAKAPGTATITVTTEDGGRTAQCVITVAAGETPGTGVTINGQRTVVLEIGETYTPTITKEPPNTSDTASWSSANSAIASVNASTGTIKGESAGTTTVTVTLRPGVSDTITVIVNPAAPQNIPTKGGEFNMQGSDTEALNYAVQVAINAYDFAGAQLKVPGTLKLSDVLASGFDYSGMTVTADPSSLNSKVAIGKDKDNADAIVISYFGAESDWLPTLGHPDQFPPVQMTLVLHKAGYADTTIKVNLAFNGSIYG